MGKNKNKESKMIRHNGKRKKKEKKADNIIYNFDSFLDYANTVVDKALRHIRDAEGIEEDIEKFTNKYIYQDFYNGIAGLGLDRNDIYELEYVLESLKEFKKCKDYNTYKVQIEALENNIQMIISPDIISEGRYNDIIETEPDKNVNDIDSKKYNKRERGRFHDFQDNSIKTNIKRTGYYIKRNSLYSLADISLSVFALVIATFLFIAVIKAIIQKSTLEVNIKSIIDLIGTCLFGLMVAVMYLVAVINVIIELYEKISKAYSSINSRFRVSRKLNRKERAVEYDNNTIGTKDRIALSERLLDEMLGDLNKCTILKKDPALYFRVEDLSKDMIKCKDCNNTRGYIKDLVKVEMAYRELIKNYGNKIYY